MGYTAGVAEPFSIYVHVPYCRTRCAYCDFNTYAVRDRPEARYTQALIAELEHAARDPLWCDRVAATIFFGGGTPSLFAPRSIRAVLETIQRAWPVTPWPGVEVTLEANPGTVDEARLRELRTAGVNRISIGVQSFHPRHLALLGRGHGAQEAIAAVKGARRAGFDAVSFDLIFAVPGQTLDEWQADVRRAISLAPEHISTYNLTYEAGTPLHRMRERGEVAAVDEDTEAEMYVRGVQWLAAAGYAQYEISNYARPRQRSRHNMNYWTGGDYLGVGAGAHSFARLPAAGMRWANERDPEGYMRRVTESGAARASEEALDQRQSRGEFVFLALRLVEGFAESVFRARFGVAFQDAFPHIAGLRRDGLLLCEADRWRLSDRGRLLADGVFVTFL